MGKFYGGPNSPYYGKVGAVVARKWRTENVVSMYQPKVSNPQTKAQTIVRKRFAELSNLCGVMAKAINIGFYPDSLGNKAFPRAIFMRKNFGNVTADQQGEVEIDYSSILIADGSLPEVHFGMADFSTANTIRVTFTPNGDDPDASTTDKVYLVAFNYDEDRCIVSEPVARNAQSVSITAPVYWSGEKVHLYGFVVKAGELNSMDDVSKSNYIGSGNME